MLPTHGRYDYSTIPSRPAYDWPGGRRLAIYFGINHEVFAWNDGFGAELAPSKTRPDVLNYAWRDYGNRVGAWRLFDLFDRLQLPATALLNAAILENCPGLAEACRDRGHEIAAHGETNARAQGELPEAEERALIRRTTEALSALGARPTGWLGPWISQSHRTPDLLKQEGYRYLLDWAHDDQPTRFATGNGPILSVPYSQEINDIPAIVARKGEAEGFARMMEDAVAQLLSECDRRPLVLGVALHPYLIGQAHRLPPFARALERILAAKDDRIWWTTAGAIADHVLENRLGI